MAQDTVTLAARQQRTERISGRFFTVLSATAKFTVELDGRIRREVRPGSKITAEPFKRISFIETEGVANTILFDAGDEQYEGEVQVSGVSNETFDYAYLYDYLPPLTVTGAGLLKIPTATFVTVPLIIPYNGLNYTRKSFTIANRTGNDVGIYDTNNKLLDIALANAKDTFFLNQDVKLQSITTQADITFRATLFNTTPQ